MMNTPLYQYVLELADDVAILGQRLGEWCGHAPSMEIDMSLTNISLDLFGQARSLYQYAAEIEGKGRTEDDICFLRDAHEFKNALLVEMPNGDFAQTMLRQYLFDEFQMLRYSQLSASRDPMISAIAERGIKETTYHRRLSSEWMKRLGDGTEESHQRLNHAIEVLWPYAESLFVETKDALHLSGEGIACAMMSQKDLWRKQIEQTMNSATIDLPGDTWTHQGGRGSVHTEYLGYILAEMQALQRAYPGLEW